MGYILLLTLSLYITAAETRIWLSVIGAMLIVLGSLVMGLVGENNVHNNFTKLLIVLFGLTIFCAPFWLLSVENISLQFQYFCGFIFYWLAIKIST